MWMREQHSREDEPSKTSNLSTSIPRLSSQSLKMSQKILFLNPNPHFWWSEPESIPLVKINGEGRWALSDSGSTINAVTLEFIKVCSLDIGPFSDLTNGTLGINGFGGVFSWPLSYVIIRVPVEGVWGYNGDQVILAIPDYTGFGFQVPVTLGTPTIKWIINMIKESEIDELSVSLNGLRRA